MIFALLASLTSLKSGNRLLDIRRKISWDQNSHKTKSQLEDLDAHVRALQIFTGVIVLCVAPHFLPLLYRNVAVQMQQDTSQNLKHLASCTTQIETKVRAISEPLDKLPISLMPSAVNKVLSIAL
jgi:hypothetical protein